MNLRRVAQALAAAAFAAGGCRSTSPAQRRAADAAAFRERLEKEAREVRAQVPGPWTLSNCLAVARARNLDLLNRRLDQRIAGLRRAAAFSAFLPQATYAIRSTDASDPYEKNFGGNIMEVQEQRVTEQQLSFVLPVFTPDAWLMYVAARRGEDLQARVRQAAEHALDLQVVAAFARCAVADESRRAWDRRAEFAERLLADTLALQREGFAAPADADGARAAREDALRRRNDAARDRETAAALLCQWMSLPPDPALPVDGASLAAFRPAGGRAPDAAAALTAPPEQWMAEALLRRPDLYAGDEAVRLRRAEIARAIALFLPRIAGVAAYSTTTDDFTVNQQFWTTGLQGTMSVFLGFRNVNEYRLARAAAEQAARTREEASLAVLVQVSDAWRLLRSAQDLERAASAGARAAASSLAAVESRRGEGLASIRELLDARSSAAAADAQRIAARYALAAALCAFHVALGDPLNAVPEKESP